MSIPARLALAACTLFVTGSALSQTTGDATKKVDSLFSAYNSETPGVAVAIVKDGRIIFKKGYGMANLEDNMPITPKTVFHIASVSKQFTAFSIYLLQKEGRISLEDDVRKYIPELPDYGATIKIRHLLAHTSGLRDQWAVLTLAGWRMDDVITMENILKIVSRQAGTNFAPGTAFGYCNTGYRLLAEIIHRVTGKTFADYAAEKIFKPLGMSSTQFYDDFRKIVKNRSDSYEMIDNVYYKKRLNYSNVGATGLLTTVEDLGKWVTNFVNPTVGDSNLIQSFNNPSCLDNGQKVVFSVIDGDTLFHAKGQLLRTYRGIKVIKHGGHDAGFRAFLARFPDQHFAVITLSNDEHYEIFNRGLEVAGFYLHDDFKPKKEIKLTQLDASAEPRAMYRDNLKDYEGKYYSDELLTGYIFKVTGNKLIMSHVRIPDIELTRTGKNKFSGYGDQTFPFDLEFLRDGDGITTGFEISNFGAKHIKFVRIK